MKAIWAGKKSYIQAEARHAPLVIRDFLKLVSAAVLCGLVVSVTAAGIALLLSGTAEAYGLQVTEPVDMDMTPGVLVVGAGCDGVELPAVERDWYVRINGRVIEVRVMQTWIMPAETEGAAVFQVQLPRGAELKSLSAQTRMRDWAGRKITTDAYARLSPANYLKLTQNHLLVANSPDGDVTTSPLVGLQAEDTVVVQYTYRLIGASARNAQLLSLTLQQPDDFDQHRMPPEDANAISAQTRNPAVQGSVWVEWVGQKPGKIVGIPREASVEHDTNATSVITGLSWTSKEMKPGEQFHLAWSL